MKRAATQSEIMQELQQLDATEFNCLIQSLMVPGRGRAPDDLHIQKPRLCFAWPDLRGFIVVANKQYCWGGRYYNLAHGRGRSVRYQRDIDPERLAHLLKRDLVDLQLQTERQPRSTPDETLFYELCLIRRQAEQQQREHPSVQWLPRLISQVDGQLQELEANHGAAWITDLLHHFELKD